VNDSVHISFVGDVYLGTQTQLSLASDILKILEGSDLVIGNQEGPICNTTNSINGKCCLKSEPETAGILKKWGIDIVSLANNHMFDYGWEGFEQTRNHLDKAGIRYLGAGGNLSEATKPLIIELKCVKIGLLAYSWEFVQTTCATETSFGCAPLDIKLMTEQIGKLKTEVDSVIVMPHWGYCEYLFPTPEQVEMGKLLIQAGATAVIGHHSHVVQGLVKEDNSLIAYSLGNFGFADYEYGGQMIKAKNENLNGAILKIVLNPNSVTAHELIHTKINEGSIAKDDSENRKKEFKKRSLPLSFANYPKYWRQYVRLRLLRRILYWANILNWRHIHKDTIVGAFLMFKEFFRTTAKK
jgi:poly-gamma-glutamate capsule biosynthesis protein CapA/YwtB (metallophosphatase superfamily)